MNDQLSSYKVTDRPSFIRFLALLRQDLLTDSESWANKNLSDFLEAMCSYAEDIQGYYDNNDPGIDADIAKWQTFADILKGATMYE
ncbi:hypothetical protein FAM09_21585 [Niastella caeni]|uniref:DUF7660 domain-containing protein n=1 Tax=Niastella caeni TaxID=2569763 RepID=A0A4S8HLC6_9BACT|nr:hypothetical protein [Niastella caeni]THU35983.1 hypothetical protein FAM09_21585 [Niastella caeni]